MFTISLVPFTMTLLFPFIPESFQWFLSNGKIATAVAAIKNHFRKCGCTLDEAEIEALLAAETVENDGSAKRPIIGLLQSPTLRWISFKVNILWFVIGMIFYAVALQAMPQRTDIEKN